MKEVTFTFFDLAYICFLKYFYNKSISTYYITNKWDYRKQIFFECGSGYWSYYCGIVKMIKETYDQKYLDDIVWIGSSAGVFPTINAAYIEDTDNAMKCMTSLLSYLPQVWYGCIGRFNLHIQNKCHREYLYKYREQIMLKQSKVFLAVLNINILCPIFSSISFCYDFDHLKDFTESCMASHGIPFITGCLQTTLFSHPKKWYIKRVDAGPFTVLFGFIFGYNKFLPYGDLVPYHLIYPHIFRPFQMNYAWLSANVDHHNELYKLGYNDAVENKKIIDNMIL